MAASLTRFLWASARLEGSRSGRNAFYYTRPKTKQKGKDTARMLAAIGGILTSATATGIYLLGRPEPQIEGMKQVPDKYSNENVIKAYLLRSRDTLLEARNFFSKPAHEKLLPQLLPPPYQRPYTLIIEMSDILIHSEYDRKVGWRHQKRPGVDKFFDLLFDHYEIVVFTSEPAMTASPIIDAMDPQQFIMYRLFRDSTNYKNGHHIKDLTNLNRGLSRVIMIDTDSKSIQLQPENGLIMKKWTGDLHDNILELGKFLITIAQSGVDDVRPVVQFYKEQGGSDFLEVFRINQAKLLAEEEQRLAELKARQSNKAQLGGGFNTYRAKTNMGNDTVATGGEETSWVSWIGSLVGLK